MLTPDGSATLSFDLHTLTARLDRAADRILRAEKDVSYRRFRALLSVRMLSEVLPVVTQRAVADELGVSEPSASRMVGILTTAGLLDITPDPAGGNRRQLRLTQAGAQLVTDCSAILEERFADLVTRSGVSYAKYATDTRRLLNALATP